MFTGIVTEIGTVERIERGGDGARLRIAAALAGELDDGESVAVSGACLTAAAVDGGAFEADVMNPTLERTTLGSLGTGDPVNLERPLRATDRLGGHLVQGHVDGTGEVVELIDDGFARVAALGIPAPMRRYVVERGSVALEGVSLTVAGLTTDGFEVALIPETLERTTLRDAEPGRALNVELDVVARYVERLVQGFGILSKGSDE